MSEQKAKYFPVSLCYHGLLGGWIVLDQKQMVYRTGKVSVPEVKAIPMPYGEIEALFVKRRLGIPMLTVIMKDKRRYTYLVFGQKRMLKELALHGVTPNV